MRKALMLATVLSLMVPAYAADAPAEIPITNPEPKTVVTLTDENRKPVTYKIIGLQKVTKQHFGFLRSRRIWHYKLEGTDREYLTYNQIKNQDVQELRPYKEAHPWKQFGKDTFKNAPGIANTAAWWASHSN